MAPLFSPGVLSPGGADFRIAGASEMGTIDNAAGNDDEMIYSPIQSSPENSPECLKSGYERFT